jgi:hypothetical protein
MKNIKRLKKAFGVDEYDQPCLPPKFSNIKISRIFHGEEMGCSYCFPHGHETVNSKYHKNRNNWKYHRKTQWRSV